MGKLCRKCGEKSHMFADCRGIECCVNCKMKGLPSEHSVLSVSCPEYVRMIERMKTRISND